LGKMLISTLSHVFNGLFEPGNAGRKGKQDRYVPLPERTLQLLRELRRSRLLNL